MTPSRKPKNAPSLGISTPVSFDPIKESSIPLKESSLRSHLRDSSYRHKGLVLPQRPHKNLSNSPACSTRFPSGLQSQQFFLADKSICPDSWSALRSPSKLIVVPSWNTASLETSSADGILKTAITFQNNSNHHASTAVISHTGQPPLNTIAVA